MPQALPRPLLVGRDGELGTLQARLADAIAGRGSLVLIGGEAGVGKTTLADTLTSEAAGAGARVLIGHCYDRSETPPYGPWDEIVRQLRANSTTSDLPLAPLLDAAPSQAALFAQVHNFLAAVSAERPGVLVFEDLHWADAASLDLFRFVARTLASLPLLLIATYRINELHRHHPLHALVPLLVREAPMTRLDLRPLDIAAARTLVDKRYDLSEEEGTRLASYLIARTEGNALFMIELLRTLEEERLLHREDEHWHAGAIARAPIPLLLTQIVDGRVSRLGDEVAALLALAAVIGQEVPLTVWGAVTGMEEDALVALAERAEAAHLVTAWANGEGISFTHTLIREVLYASVPALRRRRLHRLVGEVLVAPPTSGHPAPDPDTVAYHFQRAGDERAITWLIQAGERAEKAFARRTAAERYETTLELLREQPGSGAEIGWLHLRAATLRRYEDAAAGLAHVEQALKVAAAGDAPRLAAYARIIHSYTLVSDGTFGEALREAQAGKEILAQLPAPDEAQRQREAPFAAYLHGGTVVAWLALAGRFTEARTQGEQLLGDLTLTTRDDTMHSASVWAALAYVYVMQGDLARARQADAAARTAYDSADRHRLVIPPIRAAFAREVIACVADDPQERERIVSDAERTTRWGMGARPGARVDYAHYLRLPILVLDGRWQEATELGDQLIAEYKSYSVTYPRKYALGLIARARGETTVAWQFVREILSEGAMTEPGDLHFTFGLAMQRLAIDVALDEGELHTARQWLEAHDRWLAWSGTVLGQANAQVLWARYHWLSRASAQAEACAQAAIALAATLHQPLATLTAHRLLGEFATAARDPNTAQRHLDTALALTAACRAPYERALVLLAHADLATALGDAAGVSAALGEARAICESLGARPALARIAALTAPVASRPVAPATLPGDLSAREVEVLRLVVAGLTNAQIAEQLFISPRTINGHLTTIYGKLGVEGRPAAIRVALDHGLR